MKKTILIPVLLILVITQTFAQINFGVKGGINLSNAKEHDSNGNTYKIGFSGGLMSRVNINKKLSVQPEVLYSVKGFNYSSKLYPGSGTVNLDYISVPVLIAFQPCKRFSILAGPEFGFLTKAETKSDSYGTYTSSIYKKSDVGADLGIAYTFVKGFGAELRFNYGFNELADVQLYDAYGNMLNRYRVGGNRVFQFDLYYAFKVKR